MAINQQYLDNVKTWAGHRGKTELIRHLEGESLSRAEAMVAQCYSCMAGYSDGAQDCEVYHCPMYGFMPYGTKKEDPGKVKKVLSEEQKARMLAGRRAKMK